MKGMIAREVRRGLKDNIKLGAVVFVKSNLSCRYSSLFAVGVSRHCNPARCLPTLSAINALHLLSDTDAEQLRAAYLYLRRLENLLQSINDEQTQTLPGDELKPARGWRGG